MNNVPQNVFMKLFKAEPEIFRTQFTALLVQKEYVLSVFSNLDNKEELLSKLEHASSDVFGLLLCFSDQYLPVLFKELKTNMYDELRNQYIHLIDESETGKLTDEERIHLNKLYQSMDERLLTIESINIEGKTVF